MIADLIIPAHASAKNTSMLGGVLLPMHTLKVAKALKDEGKVREVMVITDIQELMVPAAEMGMLVLEQGQGQAKEEQIAPVIAAMLRDLQEGNEMWSLKGRDMPQDSDYTLVLTPNVPFRDVNHIARFLDWAMEIRATAAWTCEAVPCRAEMIVFDHIRKALVEQAIPGGDACRDRRLVLTTHYAIAAQTSTLMETGRLRPPETRLYQMPLGHVTWTIDTVDDLHWAEQKLKSES